MRAEVNHGDFRELRGREAGGDEVFADRDDNLDFAGVDRRGEVGEPAGADRRGGISIGGTRRGGCVANLR